MSVKHLGARFDIHTGGVDHIPVHHPNEIAQSEAALGVHPWVPYWLHGGWLMFGDSKLSKSTGGSVVNLDALLDSGIAALSYRYFLLGGHYRQQLAFSEEAIRGAEQARSRLLRHAVEAREDDSSRGQPEQAELRARFRAALADDLNAPRALAVAWEVARSDSLGGREKWELLREFDEVLALGLADAKPEEQEADAEIDALVRARDAARAAKDWKRADELRAELKRRGITLTDSPQGTRWKRG
jgi:cysteinyl-tRNA synthetase